MKSKNLLVTELDVKDLLHILTAVDCGDFSKRLPDSYVGVEGKIADTLNSIIQKNALLNQELKRIGKEVVTEGKVKRSINFQQGIGGWSESAEAVNDLVGNLLLPANEISRIEESENIRDRDSYSDNLNSRPIVLKRVSGTWRDVKDDLNFLFTNHT